MGACSPAAILAAVSTLAIGHTCAMGTGQPHLVIWFRLPLKPLPLGLGVRLMRVLPV